VRDVLDVAIVGAGAAGLATAIFLRRLNPRVSVTVLDSARRPGAKILVSGGSRCNVTNTVVTERDYWGGSRAVIRRVLRALPVPDTVAFFTELGVSLHEEADGKLFPDSNRSRDVLDALMRELASAGAGLVPGFRVTAVSPNGDHFQIHGIANTSVPEASVPRRSLAARRVVLATGGQSLPKSGSDGAGYEIARGLGHTIVPTTPALVPLLIEMADDAMHPRISGVAHEVEAALWVGGAIDVRLAGSLLWTHFGVSGPVVLNVSRHWLRAVLEAHHARITLSFVPGETFDSMDAQWTRMGVNHPRTSVQSALARVLPASLAAAILGRIGVPGDAALAHLRRADRRRLIHALVEWPLDVTGSRGYNYAEATAGGVTLAEIDPATMESRRTPGLYFVGEILDVDGRIGGFNFQWAWSSGRVAAGALATQAF
jgi:predicted Rossmann fold flavoprotein